MGISTYLANKLLDHVLTGDTYTSPTTLHISLHSADPGLIGSYELSGSAYARITATFDAADGGATQTATELESAMATPSNWSEATHFGIWDAASGGNFLMGGELDSAVTVLINYEALFPDGSIIVSLT